MSSEATRQTVVQIQSISSIPTGEVSTGQSNQQTASYLAAETISSPNQSTDEAIESQLGPSIAPELPLTINRSPFDDRLLKVKTSITTQRCAQLCPCKCHTRSQIRSPIWLKTLIGQMLFSYHGTLRTTTCNYPPCRRTPGKTDFTYFFPGWLVQRAVMISSASELSGRGATISIAMPVVVSWHDPVWNAIHRENMGLLRHLFRSGHSPYMISPNGVSLLAVRTLIKAQIHAQPRGSSQPEHTASSFEDSAIIFFDQQGCAMIREISRLYHT